MEHLLSLIIDWKMTKEEARAWKIAILYIVLVKKYFPDYRLTRYKLNSDPRKTDLFRHCYKLLRETEGKLKFNQFGQYIQAQFQILKKIKLDGKHGEQHGNVSPNCLVGESAWNRWLVWQKTYQHVAKVVTEPSSQSESLRDQSIIDTIIDGKRFLVNKLKELSRNSIMDVLENRMLFRWVLRGQLTPYYLVLSPLATKYAESKGINLLNDFSVDLKQYETSDKVKDRFRAEFDYEF